MFDKLWVEKYRPKSLDQIIGHPKVIERLKAWAQAKTMPMLMFSGGAGTGKTTTALCFAHDLYGDEWRQNFIELNASDERGIDVVRNQIKDYAQTAPMGGGFKICFLDEADNLTADAQAALRRTMERFSNNCRFILSVNYPNKIIDAIHSRCTIYRFVPLNNDEISFVIEKVALGEGLDIDEDAVSEVIDASQGDARRCINILQDCAIVNKKITKGDVQAIRVKPELRIVEMAVNYAADGKLTEASDLLMKEVIQKGVDVHEMLLVFDKVVSNLKIDSFAKTKVQDRLAEVEFRMLNGCKPLIQMKGILAYLSLLKYQTKECPLAVK